MKKLLAMVMAVAMTLSLAACGGNSTPAASGSTGSASSEAGSAANADFKVGAIYINSKNDTAGYTYAHHNGITKAMEELGLDPDSQLLFYVPFVCLFLRSSQIKDVRVFQQVIGKVALRCRKRGCEIINLVVADLSAI